MTRSLLPPRALREVIAILRVWRQIRLDLRELEADALHGGYTTDFEARSRSGTPGNPTQARALRLATDTNTRQLSRLNNAIERALRIIGGPGGRKAPQAWAMQAHYLFEQPWGKIAETLGVSRQTIWRWEQRFRVHVWEQLGRRL